MVQLTDIQKIYSSGTIRVRALDQISLHIRRNEYVAIMGASGSGKSTLMNIIGCLDNFNEGSYRLDNVEVANLTENELADIRNQKIGFVFQNFNLLSKYNALQNVELPMIYASMTGAERRRRALSALDKVGLAHRYHHRPSELSGGEKQRVAIARALVNNPAIILADEPTGNLDSQMSVEIMETFTNLHQEGATIIMVTHEPDIALHAYRTVKIFDGKIIFDENTKPYPKGFSIEPERSIHGSA